MRFDKNKWKIITPILVIAVLAAAFCFGGNAPGSGGRGGDGASSVITAAQEAGSVPAPELEPEVRAAPESEPESVPEQGAEEASTPASVPEAEPDRSVMEVDPETGKDRYQTDPVPEGKPLPAEPQDAVIGSAEFTCTVSINCGTILNNMDLCDPAKADLVPADGWILQPLTVSFYEGESVFNVLQRVCKQQKIHMEFENTPIYNSAYIEGIGNLYEFDVGDLSGWMYSVNEWFPNYGCSRYQLSDGDEICWVYTCDLGDDVGGDSAVGNGRR